MQKVRLVEVQGDQEDFADLIGKAGKLHLVKTNDKLNTFFPDDRGDFLSLAVKRVTDKNDKIQVLTQFGNKFIFRKLAS